LLTSRLNQDPLENCFSVVRNRGGYNPQPTVKQFRVALQHNMHIKLQTPIDNSNCEFDSDEMLCIEEEKNCNENEVSKIGMADVSEEETAFFNRCVGDMEVDEDEVVSNKGDFQSQQISLESCSIVYVAGYLLQYLIKTTNCVLCKEVLTTSSESICDGRELLIMNRDYGVSDNEIKYLTKPNSLFCELISVIINNFNEAFHIFKIDFDITVKIKSHILQKLKTFDDNFSPTCQKHKEHIIDQLIKIKLFRMTRWVVALEKIEKNRKYEKPHRKIRILS